MKIKFIFILFYFLTLLFSVDKLFCSSFTAGDLYLAKTDSIYWVNDQNPASNYVFISGLTSDTNRKITFSYKRGYVDHMFITDGTGNNIIKEYNADKQLINTWTVSTNGYTITDIAADIENGTTKYLYLSYGGSGVNGHIDRIDIASGTIQSYTSPQFDPKALSFIITQPGETGNLLIANSFWNGSVYTLNPDSMSAYRLFYFDYGSDDITGMALGRNADGTTSNSLFMYKKYMRECDISTGQQTHSIEYGATRALDVKPNYGAETQYLVALHNVSNYYRLSMVNVSGSNFSGYSSVANNIFQNSWDIAYVQYGWEGFIPIQWTYIKNNKTNLSETWTDDQVDILYNLYVNASGSSTVNSETWYFTTTNFNSLGPWGTQHFTGEGWVDKYGFKHIYLDNGKNITTFNDAAYAEEWDYFAKAGYSQIFGQSFNEDWNLTEVNNLYNKWHSGDTAPIIIDGESWRYLTADVSQKGFWGTEKAIGDYWVDKYGFKYVNAGGNSVLTTFDKTPVWEYLAKAGFSLTFGDIFSEDWTYDEVQNLYNFYLAGKNGTIPLSSYIIIDGRKWYYTNLQFASHNYGDYWVDEEGNKFIYLGSGLTTFQTVPEPLTLYLIITGLIGFIIRKK